ncbi:hypothetical protein ACQ4LE_002030 [Meloidogyne hapla]
MELGLSFSEFLFFLILSAFLCLVVILPSDAMQSAGFTISKVFAAWLGDERFNFVEYHLRRTLLTIMVHASLPFLCFVGLELCVPQTVFTPLPQNGIQIMAYLSFAFSAATACFLSILYLNDWERHYMVRRLRLLNNPQDGPWRELAIQINIEVRRPMLFTMTNKDCSRTIITDEWILKITNYNVNFARISDSQLVIVRSSPLHQSVPGSDGLISTSAEHLIDLRVCSRSGCFDSFQIRIRNQQELNNLRDQIGRSIEVLDSLALPQPLHERFVDAFIKELERNPRYNYKRKEDLEPCLGCSQQQAQVKLVKKCIDSPIQDGESYEKCRNCQCRPMWCARCMGRIFASKQNQNVPEIWMAGRAPCPTCRLPFCVLDVCFLSEED